MNPTPQSFTLRSSVEAFLIEESHLLDDGRYQDWLALWHPEGRYWMPCDHHAEASAHAASIINDDLRGLMLRVARLDLPNAHAMSPRPIGCRQVSNVAIEGLAPVVVRSKLICNEFQRRAEARDDSRSFAATVRHELVEHDGSWRIRLKRVHLIDSMGARTLMPVPL